jgi:hypothetical protein
MWAVFFLFFNSSSICVPHSINHERLYWVLLSSYVVCINWSFQYIYHLSLQWFVVQYALRKVSSLD